MTAERGAPGATHGLLFADLRGYSAFVEEHGDEAAVALLARYRHLVREVVASHDGAEIRTEGDSFYVVFPLASSAVRAGLAILEAARAAEPRIDVGIGVQAGETSEDDEGPIGSAVNIAARVCSQARPGELLVTDTVRALTRTRLPVRFVPRGSPRLKGITEPIPLFAVLPVGAVDDARPPLVRRGPLTTDPRFWIGGAAALVLVAAVVAFAARGSGASPPSSPPAACGGASTAPSGSHAVVSPPATLPPVGDVPFYRANAQRTSLYPGPGPVCQPAIAWQHPLGKAADFTPIVVAGTLIVGDANGLHAFDARTGAARWTAAGRVGFTASAGAADGVVFAADLGDTLHALDLATGTQRWSVALPNAGIHPLVGDGLVWVGSSDGHAYGLDPASGGRRWSWAGPPNAAIDVPFVTDDTAYIRGGGILYAVRLVDQTELWHYDTGGGALTGPVLAGDTIYVGSQGSHSELAALDRTTGKNRWAPRFSIASGNQVTPGAVVGKTLYVGTDGDGVYALQDEGASYKVLWHATGIRATARPPSYATGLLYVQQNEGPLVGLRAADGAQLWDTAPSDRGSEAPVVTGGIVYQVDDEGQVLRAWAEPALVARLAAPSSSPAASPTPALPDPFKVTATHPWFQTGIQIPAAMALAPDGLLYVLHAKADFSNPQVTVLEPTTGLPVRSWGRYGSGPGQLDLTGSDDNGPSGCIAVARNGDIYVGERGNQRVEEFAPDGRLIRQIGVGTLGFVLFCTVGPDGSLYTLDGDPAQGTMNKFGPSGQLIWHRLPAAGRGLHDFVFLPHGGFLGIVDATGEGVLIDPSSGNYAGHWGPAGQDYGGSGEPSVDARGNVYVFHYAPSALQVFDPHGRLLGGIYDDPSVPEGPYQFSNKAFWPSPLFAKDGSGYSFDSSGLVQLRVMLAGR